MRLCIFLLAFLSFIPEVLVHAADTPEVVELKSKNEQLAAKLEAANAKLEAATLKIEKLQKEIDELKGKPKAAAKEKEGDLFQEGTTWSGSRNYTQNGPSKDFQDLKLIVLTREGNKFTGEIHFESIDKKQQQLSISGTAPQTGKGSVTFKTEQKGVFQQTFKGVLAGGQISFTFSGTGVTGDAVKGTGNLKQ